VTVHPMAGDPMAAEYRRRAGELRQLAATIEDVPLGDAIASAGIDTWAGPNADECRQAMTADRARLQHAGDELLTIAWYLERRAAELEAATLGAASTGAR